jgi:hypothetical protein
MPAEYIEYVRGSLTVTAGTYGELEIKFPVISGGGGSQLPVIHSVEFTHSLDSLTTDDDSSKLHLSTRTQTDVIGDSNSDCIESCNKFFKVDGSPATRNYIDNKERRFYSPKMVYAYDSIFFGAKVTRACTVQVKIGYTMRYVAQRTLMKALVPR